MTRSLDDLRDLPAHLYLEEKLLPEWRERRQKQINAAVAIIKPPRQQRKACCEDVERAGLRLFLDRGLMVSADKARTKQGKVAAGRLATVLRRLLVVLVDPHLDGLVTEAFVTRRISSEQIEGAVRYCEELQRTRTGKLVRKSAEAKRRAVHCAHGLLTKHNKREAANTAKGCRFCKLAALLYGDPSADLHNQCAAALRKIRKESGAK